MLTQEQIQNLEGAALSEVVLQEVFGWRLVANLAAASTLLEEAWTYEAGRANVMRWHGSQELLAQLVAVPRSQQPDVTAEKWIPRIIAKMTERGFRLAVDAPNGAEKDLSAVFESKEAPKGLEPVVGPFGVAVARAALAALVAGGLTSATVPTDAGAGVVKG